MRNLLQSERDLAPSNIPLTSVTRGTDQRSGWSKLAARLNIHAIVVTFETFQESTAWLKLPAFQNNPSIVVTFETSQESTVWSNLPAS